MIKKVLLIILICVLFLNYLYSDVGNISLSKPLKLKLKGSKKFETYLLCFSEKGFVIWNSSYFFSLEDIPKYAEYHTFEELEYFKLSGKISLYPLAIGGAIILIQIASFDEHSEDMGIFLLPVVGLCSVLCTFFTIFFPRRAKPDTKREIEKFPKKYCTYKDHLPDELLKFISSHEE